MKNSCRLNMEDKQFIKNCAAICEMLLRNAAKSFGLKFDVINETMLEIESRAAKLGIKRDELYPKENLKYRKEA